MSDRPTIRWIAAVLFPAGIACLAMGAARGEVDLFLVLVFPVVTGEGPLATLGMLLAFAGLAALMVSGLAPTRGGHRRQDPAGSVERGAGERRVRGGGVVLIGPVPIAWGSDRRALVAVFVLAVLLVLGALALMLVLGVA